MVNTLAQTLLRREPERVGLGTGDTSTSSVHRWVLGTGEIGK
ncbi:MAG: hypothetical protein V7K77_11330 [Nostoc sp.]